MKLSFWIRLWRFILVNLLSFACNIIVCDPFFIPVMHSSRNGSSLALCKKTCCYRSMICLVLFTESMWNPNTQLADFPHLFQVTAYGVDCDVFSLSANSRVLWHALYSTNDFKASASKSDERPDLGSSFNDVSPEKNFTNQFHTAQSFMVPSPYTLHILSAVSVALFLCLNSHNIT